MGTAIKNKKKVVTAYRLGANCEMEAQLIREGAIRIREDGKYELFSQEAVNGTGEIALSGDYFKVTTKDGKHFPYPNEKSWFEENHVHLQDNEYEQLNKPQVIWEVGDPVNEEMQYLLDCGKLTIKEDDENHYFNAFLWGSQLSAAKNAVVVFYNVERDNQKNITDIIFNFVARSEFEKSYSYC